MRFTGLRFCGICDTRLAEDQGKFCSLQCRDEARRRRETRECPECGGSFECMPSSPKRNCSPACAARARCGERNCRFNGGLSESDGRTIIVHRDGSWTFYYRALMEAHLRRTLRPGEVVHHINGDPSDDRLENLQVLTRAEHIEVHRGELLAARGVAR